MKILITGSKGQLGNELQKIIKDGQAEIGKIDKVYKNAQVIAIDVDELDITDLVAVREVLNKEKPEVVINCAAYTNVDGCETDIDVAFKVNAIGPRNLAIASEEIHAKLVHVSTDYVFNGEGNKPLCEYENTAPTSVYGKTKLAGENFVKDFSSKYFIVRTAWLYGYVGKNFVYTMMRLGKEKESLSVVNDQRGNPTNANDLAYELLKIALTEEYGIYHCTGEGECTWYDFAKKIMDLAKLNCKVKPCTSEEFPSPTKRPAYSSLDNMMLRCTVGNEMRNWEEALENFMKNTKN